MYYGIVLQVTLGCSGRAAVSGRREADAPWAQGADWGFSACIAAQLALFFAVQVALGDGPALVVDSTSAGKSQLDLGKPALEIQAKGYEGKASLLGLSQEAVYLAAVKEKFSGPPGVNIEPVALLIGAYMDIVKPEFPAARLRKTVANVGGGGANRLDLCASKGQAGFNGLLDLIFVPGPPVYGHDLEIVIVHCRGDYSLPGRCVNLSRRSRPADFLLAAGHFGVTQLPLWQQLPSDLAQS